MIYVYIHKDITRDKHYHIKNCDIVKTALKDDPSSYKHTSVEAARVAGYINCPKCNPDDPRHSVELVEKIVEGRHKSKPTTTKKECPKCGSKNVIYQGISGGTRFVKEGESAPIEYHDFKCNDCGAEFRYYGDL